ncbi:hypothetical protein B566_EDAN009038 [Ephemera danica]|nr:hypothetical protein B566_EDAN009038 [Ephemera danica]
MKPSCTEDYVCSLSAEAEEQARRELREDPATRDHALKLMRQWIAKHPDIRNCRTDAVFLLRFLRTRKFSIPQAQEMLERYLAMRETNVNWFRNLDVNDKIVNEIIERGYIVPLPERDSFGRQVIFTCIGRLDPHRYTAAHVIRAHSVVIEVLMDDEETHVCGVVNVSDKNLPMRLKGTHFISLPTVARQMFEFFSSLHNDKLKSRLKVHNTLDDFRKDYDVKILPKEYGGEVPLADMISQFQTKMKSREANVHALEKMHINIRPGSKLSNEVGADDAVLGVTGSFRKLEVD